MQFLIRRSVNSRKSAAHIWRGNDTFCTMFSTGGMNPKRYIVHDDPCDRRICHMCNNNYEKVTGKRV